MRLNQVTYRFLPVPCHLRSFRTRKVLVMASSESNSWIAGFNGGPGNDRDVAGDCIYIWSNGLGHDCEPKRFVVHTGVKERCLDQEWRETVSLTQGLLTAILRTLLLSASAVTSS